MRYNNDHYIHPEVHRGDILKVDGSYYLASYRGDILKVDGSYYLASSRFPHTWYLQQDEDGAIRPYSNGMLWPHMRPEMIPDHWTGRIRVLKVRNALGVTNPRWLYTYFDLT